MSDLAAIAATLVLATESPNGRMYGDHGRAFGPAQVHAERLADFNRQHPAAHVSMADMADARIAFAVVYLDLRDRQERRHYRSAVQLAEKWRVPYGKDKRWHRNRLERAGKERRT